MSILVTGVAGFIGYHLANTLLQQGYTVFGVDNLNHYYDVHIKHKRLSILQSFGNFLFIEGDIANDKLLLPLLKHQRVEYVLHMAAQAGVRYSLEEPRAYVSANIVGMHNVLDACAHANIKHLIYASSSSVYGADTPQPARVDAVATSPVSFYAATKRAGELFASVYSQTHGLRATGLRFFTVYGPYGRPDMAVHRFSTAIMQQKPIEIYNSGHMSRDMTYISDAVTGILSAMRMPLLPNAPLHRIYNIGSGRTVPLLYLISCIEEALQRTTQKTLLPMQTGDVPTSWADLSQSQQDFDYAPQISIEQGIALTVSNFVNP